MGAECAGRQQVAHRCRFARVVATILLIPLGCTWFDRPAPSAATSDAPRDSRHVAVQFHLAGFEAAEGRVPMATPAGATLYIDPTPALTRADIDIVRAYHGEQGDVVELVLNFEGRNKLAELTRSNVGQHIAVLVDGELRSAFRIRDPIDGGRAFISGLTGEEADALATSFAESP